MKPKKWTDVYPHGTKEGDEELKFFIALARNPKYQWRSTSAIAKEAGLTRERVEEIINKYYKKNMVFQNPKNEDQWGYWERVPEMLPKVQKSISQKDQDDRINKLNKDSCSQDDCCGGSCHDASWDAACDKVDFYVKPDGGKVYCINIKNNSEKFIQRLKEMFHKKKELRGQATNHVVCDERWHPPATDEDGWWPIRPKQEIEEELAAESESAWELDL